LGISLDCLFRRHLPFDMKQWALPDLFAATSGCSSLAGF
jgi:hypothetical protein